MKSKKWSIALGIFAVILFAYSEYSDLMREKPAKYDPQYWFPDEPGIREIVQIPWEAPPIFLPSLLKEEWDYVCFLGPGLLNEDDPMLAGLDLPSMYFKRMHIVVLRRGGDHDSHIFYDDEVVRFVLHGIAESSACYDSTSVFVGYVERPWPPNKPKTLHITPKGWSGDG